MTELPTVEQELTRKALVQVERVFCDYKHRRISKRELELCLEMAWNICSGLCTESFFEVITASSQELAKLEPDVPGIQVLLGPQKILVVCWRAGDVLTHVLTIPTGMRPQPKHFGKPDSEKPHEAAFAARTTIINRALMQGFKSLEVS